MNRRDVLFLQLKRIEGAIERLYDDLDYGDTEEGRLQHSYVRESIRNLYGAADDIQAELDSLPDDAED